MAVVNQLVEYEHQGTVLEAYAAWDDHCNAPRPAVLIAHMWGGRVEFCLEKARMLADLGYVGFALDMFGKGVFGNSPEQNRTLMQPFLDDASLRRGRLLAAFDCAQQLEVTDAGRIGAIGYCFGGSLVIDLARVCPQLACAVSLHGLLPEPPERAQSINARIMILHGDRDPMVAEGREQGVRQELTEAGADWQFIALGHAMHSFSNPEANDPDFGTVYDAKADQRSWRYTLDHLAESLRD